MPGRNDVIDVASGVQAFRTLIARPGRILAKRDGTLEVRPRLPGRLTPATPNAPASLLRAAPEVSASAGALYIDA
jgi:hypothetical protein